MKKKAKAVKDYEGCRFELGGPEGFNFKQLKIDAFTYPGEGETRIRKRKPIRITVQVIGFQDDIAPIRNWGAIV